MSEGNEGLRADRLRERVWREFVKHGNENQAFERAANTMGVFSFMRIVDSIVNAVVAEQNELEPMNLRLDSAESEIRRLRKLLDDARRLIGAAP